MKILLLCNKSPWPPREGGPIAMNAMITGLLKAGHQVRVLAANTNKYSVEPSSVPVAYRESTSIEFAYIDLSIKPLAALSNYLSGESYHVSRFRNREFTEKLEAILKAEEFDVIQCEMLYTTAYLDIIRKHSKAAVFLRAHNIEHLIWKRIADHSHNPLKRHYLKHLYLTLRDYELNTLDKVDGIVAITGKDADFFKKHTKTPVIPIPYGIDYEPDYQRSNYPESPSLFHIGAMNWIPNAEGIQWFLEEVWPTVNKEFPELKLHLAGRMMPEWLLNRKQNGVIIEGEVPDALEFISKHSIMIVPLFSGSGIRIKIIEAMQEGRAVISTRIGAEGIEAENEKNILLAEDQQEFVNAIRRLLNEKGLIQMLGEEARELIMHKHSNKKLIEGLIEFYREVGKRIHPSVMS